MSLFEAIHKHDLEECERLAKLKVEHDDDERPYNKENYYLGPLGLALLYGYDDIVILLRQHGYKGIGIDAIDIFVRMNMITMVRFYLKNKYEDPNYINEEGKSLLHIAAEMNNFRIVKLLLKYHANPNIKDLVNDQTPLCSILQKKECDFKIVKILLKYGANPNISAYDSTGNQFNPLQIAIKRQKHESMDLIVKYISKQKEKEYLLILAARELDENSLLHCDYLPRDMFLLIFSQVWQKIHLKHTKNFMKNVEKNM